MDARRLRLHELFKPKLDEEPARELVLALPADPHDLVTKDYLDRALDARLGQLESRLTWRMITIMGAWTAIATSLFALMSRLFE